LEPWLGYLKFVYCVVGVLFAFVWLVRFMHRHRRVRAGRSTMARRWNKLGWRPEAVVKYLFKRKRTAAVPLKFTDKVLTCSLAPCARASSSRARTDSLSEPAVSNAIGCYFMLHLQYGISSLSKFAVVRRLPLNRQKA